MRSHELSLAAKIRKELLGAESEKRSSLAKTLLEAIS